MKLVIILLVITGLQVTATPLEAQNVTLSENNISLKKVFKKIRKQTGYQFFYEDELLKESRPVDIHVRDMPLKEVLDDCFKGQPLSYGILGNIIVVKEREKEKEKTGHYPVIELWQLSSPISGTVADSVTGRPLAGVTIQVKGTTNGAVTDANGHFTLDVPDHAVLIVSFLGYVSKEVPVNGGSDVTVSLAPTVSQLDEVVSIGFTTMKKREVSSVIDHLDASDLNKVGNTSPLMAMQGKVPNLNVENRTPSDPNSLPSLQLRGISSRALNMQPLFVVDGIVGASILTLDQNDIKSVDVLKGGAATALYGTRGSNGVIIITTKSGKEGISVQYNGYASFDLPIRNRKTLKTLSAEEYVKGGYGQDFGGRDDWFKGVARDFAFADYQNLRVSGGNQYTTFMASLMYRTAEALDKRGSRKEYGGRIKLDHRSKNGLFEFGVSFAPRIINTNAAAHGAFQEVIAVNPTIPIMDPDDPTKFNAVTSGLPNQINAVEEVLTTLQGSEIDVSSLSGSMKVNILKNLNTKVVLSQDRINTFGFGFIPSTNTYRQLYAGGRNSASRSFGRNDKLNFQWTGNYFLDKGVNHLNAIIGYFFEHQISSSLSGSNQDIPRDQLLYNNLGSGSWDLREGQNGVGSHKEDSRMISFFGRVAYNYDYKYFLTAGLRREGSSRFGRNNKWGNFPSVSAGWFISNENFFKSTWISSLKLRGDFGVSGNSGLPNYRSLSLYQSFDQFGLSYDGSPLIINWGPVENPNPDLRWEKNREFNIGFDAEFFNNNLAVSLSYYNKTSVDLLGDYLVANPPNFAEKVFLNVGTMRNKGIEVQIDANVVKTKNFGYSVSFNGSVNKNKLVRFAREHSSDQNWDHVGGLSFPTPIGSGNDVQLIFEGKPMGAFYLNKFSKIDDDGKVWVTLSDGKEVLSSTQSNSPQNASYAGSGIPKVFAGLTNTFTYKNWDLSVFMRGIFGFKAFNVEAVLFGTRASTGVGVLEIAEHSKYSKITDPNSWTSINSYYLEPADFVKIDNITLGYHFKLNAKYLKGGKIYLTGRNLATFTKWMGGDPDFIPTNGIAPGIDPNPQYYPSSTQVLIGLSLDFE